MQRRHVIAGTPEVNIPIRVRGMSHDHRYFDEQTSTTRVVAEFIVARLQNHVDLDSELHITNIRTQVGGTFRVAWTKSSSGDVPASVGLELLEPEGEIWEPDSFLEYPAAADNFPALTLQCQRCRGTLSVSLPEAETESLGEGFVIARPCDTCKATTGWIYVIANAASPEAQPKRLDTVAPDAPQTETPAPSAGPPPGKPGGVENRLKGRAPIRMSIKITRHKYGRTISDICETINVSRTGVYFSTDQHYDPEESVEVVLPYHKDSVAIPVPARVVRLDVRPDTYKKRVAVQLSFGTIPGR